MHEIGIVRSMCKTIEDYAREKDVKEISEIVLENGELSLVVSKYVEDLFPVVAGDSPLFQGTKLIIESVPGLAECDDCDEIFNVIEHDGYCPNCGSFDKTVLSGKDFNIKEIHIPE